VETRTNTRACLTPSCLPCFLPRPPPVLSAGSFSPQATADAPSEEIPRAYERPLTMAGH